jgi:tetratricopeptide (TPR) repeat protein
MNHLVKDGMRPSATLVVIAVTGASATHERNRAAWRLHSALLAHHRAGIHVAADRSYEAFQLIEKARFGYEEVDDRLRLRYLRTLEQSAWAVAGEHDTARQLAQASLADAIESGDHTIAVIETANIGIHWLEIGDDEAARQFLQRGLRAYRLLRWRSQSAHMLALLGRLEIRHRGLDGLALVSEACRELDALDLSGDWAETRLETAEELLKVDSHADVEEFCYEAYTRAVSLGRSILAQRALDLLECVQPNEHPMM